MLTWKYDDCTVYTVQYGKIFAAKHEYFSFVFNNMEVRSAISGDQYRRSGGDLDCVQSLAEHLGVSDVDALLHCQETSDCVQ